VLTATVLSTVLLSDKPFQKVDCFFALENAKILHRELKGYQPFTLSIIRTETLAIDK
jgi:hypothetical protein